MDKQALTVLLIFVSLFSLGQKDTLSKPQEYNEIVVQGEGKSSEDGASNIQESTDKLMSLDPAITLIKRGNYAQEPTVRGLNAGQITTTIDGMQMFGACTDRMDPVSSYVEPTNLEKIQLSTTSGGNETGSSVGGGVNFALMKAQLGPSRKWSGKLGAGYQTNANNLQGLGTLQYSSKKWAVLVNGIYRKADNYHAANHKEILYSQFEKWNVGINLVIALNENNRLSFDYIQDEGYNIGYPALTMDVGYAKAYIGAVTHTFKKQKGIFRSLKTKGFWNFVDHTMDDTQRPDSTIAMHMDMPGKSTTYGFFSEAKGVIGKKHLIKARINAFENQLHAEMTMYPEAGSEMFMLTIPDGRRRTMGLKVSDKWLISSQFNLNFGGRVAIHGSAITTKKGRQTLTSFYDGDPQKTRLSGNVFVEAQYNLTRHFDLYGGVEYAQRPSSLQELYGFYLFNRVDNYDYLGNPSLENEQSINGHLGAQANFKNWAISGELFINSFDQYITGMVVPDYSNMTNGASGVKQYQNIGRALLTGGELKFSWNPIKNLKIMSTNSYTYGIDQDQNYLPYIPPFKSVNSVSYGLKGYHLRVEYIGALAQNNVSMERYGETKTPGFNLFNAKLHKKFQFKNSKSLHAEIGVENIFDTAYYQHLDIMKIQRQGLNVVVRTTFVF